MDGALNSDALNLASAAERMPPSQNAGTADDGTIVWLRDAVIM